jgi:hypothetical protein
LPSTSTPEPRNTTYQLLGRVLGQSDQHEWYRLINRLESAIENKEPLSDLGWARAVFLTDISFGSTLVGSGLRFGRAPMDTGSRYCAHSKKKSAVANAFFCLCRTRTTHPPSNHVARARQNSGGDPLGYRLIEAVQHRLGHQPVCA